MIDTPQTGTTRGSGQSGQRLRTLRSLAILAALLATIVGQGGPFPTGGVNAQAAVVPMQTTDTIRGAARGSAASAIAYASRYGAARPTDVASYIGEVYRLAPLLGFDPAIVVAQSALETDTWRTTYWANHLNPAGIGITYDGQGSFTWSTGIDAARGQLVHLYVYAVGPVSDGHVLAPYRELDPRYAAAIAAGYAGSARTIGDLTGRWATDPAYGPKIAGRGNDHLYRYRVSGYAASAGSGPGPSADDLSPATAWESPATGPPSAFVQFDLGAARPVGLVRWLHRETGFADALTIQTSIDGASWATLLTAVNAPALQWQGTVAGRTARFFRFAYANPNRDVKLGSLAEVQFFPPATTGWPFVTWSTPAAPGPVRLPTLPEVTPTTPALTPNPAPVNPTATPQNTAPMPTLASRTIRGGTTPVPTALPGTTQPPPPDLTPAPTATPGSRTIRQ
ncbi:MAG: discoidin domain-containing protein [Chloroflexota bacterium]|nr:discoidin domain-containing protein [Chloroflexota bacterium]